MRLKMKKRRSCLVETLEIRRLLTTWIVDTSGSGDFTVLTQAIGSSSVQNGDTVLVHPGTYLGLSSGNGYPVGKSLTIQSTGGAASTILTVPDGTTNAVTRYSKVIRLSMASRSKAGLTAWWWVISMART